MSGSSSPRAATGSHALPSRRSAALAADGYRPAVTEYDGLSLAGASRHCARRVPVPLGEVDAEGYAKAVRAELETRPYLAVFPSTDAALVALDAPVQHLINKESSARLAEAAGLPVPPSRRVRQRRRSCSARPDELEYPIVVKPVVKRYAAARVESAQELEAFAGRDGAMIVQPYLRDNLRGVVGLMWQGKLMAATHLRYLPRVARTVRHHRVGHDRRSRRRARGDGWRRCSRVTTACSTSTWPGRTCST